MRAHLFCAATLLSGVLAVCSLTAWIMPPLFSPTKFCITAVRGSYISVLRINGRGCAVIFNYLQFGPPISLVTGINGSENPDLQDTQWVHLGIYYRCLHARRYADWWFFGVSLFYFVLLFAILPISWLFRRAHAGQTNRLLKDDSPSLRAEF